MELYTADEVRKAISEARFLNQQVMPNESIIDRLSSIELPSDEEITTKAHSHYMKGQMLMEPASDTEHAFKSGAEWILNKIKRGNK